jgi:hypothetical protein
MPRWSVLLCLSRFWGSRKPRNVHVRWITTFSDADSDHTVSDPEPTICSIYAFPQVRFFLMLSSDHNSTLCPFYVRRLSFFLLLLISQLFRIPHLQDLPVFTSYSHKLVSSYCSRWLFPSLLSCIWIREPVLQIWPSGTIYCKSGFLTLIKLLLQGKMWHFRRTRSQVTEILKSKIIDNTHIRCLLTF